MNKRFVKSVLISMLIALMAFPSIAMASKIRSNQDATDYYDAGKGASGETLEIGLCAVHYQNGNHLSPVILFGIFIYHR